MIGALVRVLQLLIGMQAGELVKLGAWIAVNGHIMLCHHDALPDRCVCHYWSASSLRCDRWTASLAAGGAKLAGGAARGRRAWDRVEQVVEEIFATEVLTRVWTAVATEHERRRGSSYVAPVLRSVLLGHRDARNRALAVMFEAQDANVQGVMRVNRVRALSERWTDLLLAQRIADCSVGELAFDARRVGDFAADLADRRGALSAEESWQLIDASLRATLGGRLADISPNADLNRAIASAILACFPSESWSTVGTEPALWMLRLSSAADQAESLVDDLLISD